MTEQKRGGPPSRGGPGGGGRDGGGRGGPRKGGGFGKGPVRAARAETYESLKELTRGEGFRIDKFMVAEKGTHKLVKTEYRLTREGLKDTQIFQRLVDAQAAAIAPLPEPEPEPVEEIVEAAAEGPEAEGESTEGETTKAEGEATDVEAAEGDAPAETVESVPAEGEASAEHVATEEAAG